MRSARRRGAGQLALSALDQLEGRVRARLGVYALVAPREDLAHRRVVVARSAVVDVEAAVFRFLHLLAVVDNARGHRRFTHRVADVEAFDALHALGQPQRLAQRLQPPFLRGAVAHALADRQLRVLARHFKPDAAFAVRGVYDIRIFKLHRFARHDQRRQRLVEIMLLQKRSHYLAGGRTLGVRGEEAAVADVPAAADHHQVDAGDAALDGAGDDVGVHAAVGFDVLARLHP